MPVYIEAGGSQDIMDYVIDSDEIALAGSRNKDRTLISGEFDLTVSNRCPPEHIALGTIIEIATDDADYCEYLGYVVGTAPQANNRSIKVTIVSALEKLKDYRCTWDNLHADLSAGNSQQYWTDDYSNYNPTGPPIPSAQCLWIVETMFSQALSGIATYSEESGLKDTILAFIYEDDTNRQMEMEHLRMDEYMLCAIGGEYAGQGQGTITYFEFISEFMSQLDLKLELSTTTAKEYVMKKIDPTGLSIATDFDNIYSKKEVFDEGKKDGYQYDHKWYDDGVYWENPGAGYTNRIKYQGPPTSNLASHKTVEGAGKNFIDIPTNWQYYWEKHWVATPPETYVSHNGNYPDKFYGPANFTRNKVKKVVNDWHETTYEGILNFETDARINKVMVEKQRMKIITEQY